MKELFIMARSGKTTTNGGQCVIYAGSYFGETFGVQTAAQIWTANTVRQLSGPKSGCCAVWTGGSGGAGHVGVVESWNSTSQTMTFSDSNYDGDEIVYRNTGISQSTMKGYFGSSYTFKGYVEFK